MCKVVSGIVILMFALCADVAADFDKGLRAYKNKDFATAMKEWMPLADQGDAEAQLNIGVMYASGQGVQKNEREAVRWYRSAAERGSPVAQTYLGWMYRNGVGITQDVNRAATWFVIAAQQGDPSGQRAIGLLYRDGVSVQKNPLVAYAWLSLAVSAGLSVAQEERDLVAQDLSPNDLVLAQRLSAQWQRGTSISEVGFEGRGAFESAVTAPLVASMESEPPAASTARSRPETEKSAKRPKQKKTARAVKGDSLDRLPATAVPRSEAERACIPDSGIVPPFSDKCYNGICVRTFDNGCTAIGVANCCKS